MTEEHPIPHHLGGNPITTRTDSTLPVESPLDGAPLGRLALASSSTVDQAVQQAQRAFENWSHLPSKERVQPLYRFKQLAETHLDDLAAIVSRENGKTHAEAKAGLCKGLEVVEFACSLPALEHGGHLEVSPGVDCYTRRFPLGVVAGITPFNFPAMVPLWMFPLAIACGNTFVLKPSEKVPMTPLRLVELLSGR